MTNLVFFALPPFATLTLKLKPALGFILSFALIFCFDLGFGFEEDEGVVDVADAGTSADDDVTPAEVLLTLPVLAASLPPCSTPAVAAAAAALGTWTRKAALTGLWSDVTNSGHAFRRERVTSCQMSHNR